MLLLHIHIYTSLLATLLAKVEVMEVNHVVSEVETERSEFCSLKLGSLKNACHFCPSPRFMATSCIFKNVKSFKTIKH